MKVRENFILIIFGATGDLTNRKLIPAIYSLKVQNLLPEKFEVVVVSRSRISDDDFRKAVRLGICKINFYTEMSAGAVARIREYLNGNQGVNSLPDVINKGFEEAKNIIKKRL